MRTKTILAAVAATLVAAVGVTVPALGSVSDAGKTTVVTPMMGTGGGSYCC
jgi:hypothetical protein